MLHNDILSLLLLGVTVKPCASCGADMEWSLWHLAEGLRECQDSSLSVYQKETPPNMWKSEHLDIKVTEGWRHDISRSMLIGHEIWHRCGCNLGIGYSLQVDADPNHRGAGEEMLGEQSDVWLWNDISGEHQALLLPSVNLLLILQLFSRLQQTQTDLD